MADHSKILAFISSCDDVEKLKLLIKNARDQGDAGIANTAFRRLIALSPSDQPGTVEDDFWRTIHAFEYALSEERGKTTRLSRTRQKVARVGVLQTLKDWAVSSNHTDGFRMLLDREMPEYTGEAIVLRHPSHFDEQVRSAARRRLEAEGVDVGKLPTSLS